MKPIILFSLLFATIIANAQNAISPIICGNQVFSDIIKNKYPDLDKGIRETFDEAKKLSFSRSNEPLTIKVVVHIVWNETVENLHDSIIQNQINVLNNDYNRLNADTNNLRTVFHGEAGTANIHFELVEIVRVHTDQLFAVDLFGTNLLAEVKHTADGGSDAWDPESYLNLWIVKIQPLEIFGLPVGQILGFAFPPAGLEHWPDGVAAPSLAEDGVVLDFRVVGKNNPNTIENPDGTGTLLTVHGRSATHEVGHYLGLRHIWGDGGLLGPNDCQQSDGIDDTPYADSQSAFDCDKSKNSCSRIEPHYSQNMPDLIENYMDYAAEDCMNMFTKGQVELMRNVLQGPRSGLIEPVSSVNDINPTSFVTISPNPAAHYVDIKFELIDATDLEIKISDINGRDMFTTTSKFYESGLQNLSIALDKFLPGIYFISFRSHNGIRVEKLVVGRFD